MRLAALALALALPAAAQAQVFELRLGDRVLGTLTFGAAGSGATWSTNLDNTPLGVADGVFTATSEPVQTASGEDAVRYRGITGTTRTSRVIEVIHAAGRVLSTAVAPQDDATELSDAARVPPGVNDPVQSLARLLTSDGCPESFLQYDGRRVVAFLPESSSSEGGRLVCELDYRVVAGPGHLSPLGLTSLDVTLTYDQPAGSAATLREMDIRTGPFRLRVVR